MTYVAQDFSFDIVSQVSMPELANAVDQARREIVQRFDFKNTGTMIDGDERYEGAPEATPGAAAPDGTRPRA